MIEAHRSGSWRALTGGHAVQTVEDCIVETPGWSPVPTTGAPVR